MFRDPLALLAYEVKRRPTLADLVAQVDNLSEAEIRAQPVDMPWMHEALLRLKADHRAAALEATLDDWAVHGSVSDPMGVMRSWSGPDSFIRVGRTELLMTDGQLIWLTAQGLWIDTIFTRHIDPKLIGNTVFKAQVTRSHYYEAIRNRSHRTGVISNKPEPQSSAFQIFRPPTN